MNLNPFENEKNQYDLKQILEKGWWVYDIKEEYKSIFGNDGLGYDTLVKCINTDIEWHILETGSYQGDFWYIAQYNDKFYFIQIGYGSCSGCDALQASCSDIDDLISLQDDIKRDIREFENIEELISYVINTLSHWYSEKEEVLNFIKKEFNIDFEQVTTIKIKPKE